MGYIEMFNYLHPNYFAQNYRHVFLFVVPVLFYLLTPSMVIGAKIIVPYSDSPL